MSIRTRLAVTFAGLIVFGVTAIASYAILFIREFLTEEGKRQLVQEARYVEAVIAARPCQELPHVLEGLNRLQGYDAQVFDEKGQRLVQFAPYAKPWAAAQLAPASPNLLAQEGVVYATRALGHPLCAEVAYLRIARPEQDLYAPITRVRWIIYTGMFLSIGLVVLVSTWSARSIARPIQRLKAAAEAIASGDTTQTLALKRTDEVGQLAQSLNRMATQLREDAQQLKAQAERTQQFYADIAHEVRNPLHTALGTLELLELGGLPPEEVARHRAVVRTQLERLQQLFNDLMTLVRAEEDPHFLHPQRVELAPLLAKTADTFRPEATAKGLVLRVETHTQWVVADPARLAQVLDNLVSNAVKYTDAGTVLLTAQAENGGVAIRITDTGVGIAPEHVEKLTDRFYRADESRSRKAGGTGLGLAVVKRLAEAHGGYLQVTSQLGQGTTACIWLPGPPVAYL